MTATPASDAPPASSAVEIDLRPLSTTELIDRGFALYRANFAGLLLLALLCQIAPLISHVIFTATKLYPTPGEYTAGSSTLINKGLAILSVTLLAQAVSFCLEIVLTFYIADAYLGKTLSIKNSFRRFNTMIGASIWTCFLIRLLIALSMIFPFIAGLAIIVYGMLRPPEDFGAILIFSAASFLLLLASIVPLLIIFMRLMVTLPAVALERLSGWKAVKRSAQLVRFDPGLGILYWGEMRLSFLFLPLFVIESLVLFLTSLPLLIVQFNEGLRHGSPSHLVTPTDATLVISQIMTFTAGALILPLYTIATTIFYYDVRIRREGFDLECMANRLGGKP